VYESDPLVNVFRDVTQNHSKCLIIVLQACTVLPLAQRIVETCPNVIVIGWASQVLNDVCDKFSIHFYDSLLASFRSGGGTIYAQGVLEAFNQASINLEEVGAAAGKATYLSTAPFLPLTHLRYPPSPFFSLTEA